LEDEGGGIKGGLGFVHSNIYPLGLKLYISKEKSKASKEVKEGKKFTIKGEFRA